MIEDKNGTAINSMGDWSTSLREKHWKPGRSAHSIADYILNRNGIDKIRQRLAEIFKQDIFFERAIPELEIKFDKYRQGRVHDLGIYGVTQTNSTLFVGIESKVDESFGQSIAVEYLDANARFISGERTKKPERIEGLLKKQFRKMDKSVFTLRYQLLYAVAGTISAKMKTSVLYVIVFKTELYDDLKGIDNYRDYINFLQAVKAVEQNSSRPDSVVHKFELGRKEIISIYEQVDLKS